MFEIPVNGLKYLKKSFSEAPFLMWNIVYLILLTKFWLYIGGFISQFSSITQIISLGAIPLFLWIYEIRKSRAKNTELFAPRKNLVVPSDYVERLRALIPNNQIELFDAIFLPVLAMLYSAFSEIGAEEYFTKKYDDVCKVINTLKRFPELYTNQQSYKSRDRTITAFCIFRVLFSGAVEHFQEENQKKHQNFGVLQDIPWVLIKRVPAKLGVLLGAQHWRIYEFWTAIYGDIKSLKLNEDTINYLQKAEELILEAKEDRETAKENLVPVKPVSTDIESVGDDNNIFTPTQDETKNSSLAIVANFVKWLENKVNSPDRNFALNEGDVFISPLEYGKGTLFITSSVLDKYSSIVKLSSAQLIHSLREFNRLGDKAYIIEKDSKKIDVIKINGFSIQKETYKTSIIKEVNH